MSAIISPCGTYRYTLHRAFPSAFPESGPCLFVMLNPSKADATRDDATIRRCIGFAKRWKCNSLTVVNLFALRSTNPAELAKHADPFGPDNARHLSEQVLAHQNIGLIVVAWGAHQMAKPSQYESHGVLQSALITAGAQCLGMNADGSPKHPLRLRADTPLIRFKAA